MSAHHQGLLFLTLPTQWIDCRLHSGLGGDMTRQMSWTIQRDIPYHITSGSAIKGKRKAFRGLAIFYSGTGWASVHPQDVVSDCLYITCFVFFLSLFFPLSFTYWTIICLFVLSWPPSFLAFIFPFLFPHPTEGDKEWMNDCVVLECPPGLTHITSIKSSAS